MTAQDLNNQVERISDNALEQWRRNERRLYLDTRKTILTKVRDLWDKARIEPRLDETIGQTIYVDRAEANKYGRLDKLEQELARDFAELRRGDAVQIETQGLELYITGYVGSAWVFSQGYNLAVRPRLSVEDVAAALYSDFYGRTPIQTATKNITRAADDVLGIVKRGLNQGFGYSKIARDIERTVNQAYRSALTVATTEGGRMQSQAYLNSLQLLDATGADYKKQWLKKPNGPGRENREDHFAMDGEQADDNGIFRLPSGATGPAPRLTGNPGDDISCLCSTITVIDGLEPQQVRISGDIIPYSEYREQIGGISLSEVRKLRR